MLTSPWFWIVLLGGAAVHRLLPARARVWFVALLSFGFLFGFASAGTGSGLAAFFGPQRVSLLVFLTWGALCWKLAPVARTRPGVRHALVLGLLAYLAYYKYVPAILGAMLSAGENGSSLVVPVGISYFTFKLIHFVVDLGRRGPAKGSAAEFIAFLFLFPAFTAGPIERFDHFIGNRQQVASRDQLVSGLTRILVGLAKKFAIVEFLVHDQVRGVDPFVLATNPVFGFLATWHYLIAWYVYVYLDFSAYTDIAIGSARLFGIEVMENFDWPIFAVNIGAFWKKWHMTLANWCQSYVYLPVIGLTRNPYMAVFATFLAIGLWHGASANWVLWGLYHGTGVATYLTYTRWQRKRRGPVRPVALASRSVADWSVAGVATAGTGLFVSAGFAFSATHVDGQVWQRVPVAFALLGKCLGLS